jgi:DNA polymerase-3 subunit beta
MSVTVSAKDLIDVATFAAHPLKGRSSDPVLLAAVLEAKDGLLTISGRDWDDHARATVEVDGELPMTLVFGRMLADVVKRASGDVTLSLDDSRLVVNSGRGAYRLHVMPSGSYPLPGEVETPDAVEALAWLVARVAPSAATDKALAGLCGVYLQAQDGHLTASATNKYIVSHSRVPWAGGDLAVNVPARRLLDAVNRMDDVVHLGLGDVLAIRDRRRYASMTVIDAAPANFAAVLNAPLWNGNGHVDVDRAELLGAIDAASPMFGTFALLDVSMTADGIEVQHHNVDQGEAESWAPAALEGEPRQMTFMADYLRMALNGLDQDVVRIHFGPDTKKPAQVTGVIDGAADMTTRHFVMPIIG